MSDPIFTAEEHHRLLVEGAKDYAMILLDADACIVSWNNGAERIMGWSEGEVLGQSADLIFTPEDLAGSVPEQELIRAASEGKALDLRWHVKKDGTRFFADGITEGLRGPDGTLRGYAKILRDATDSELARMALRDSQKQFRNAQNRLEAALSAGGIATWTWDIATDKVVADANLSVLFSVSKADAAGGDLSVYLQAIHPDDRERVAAEIAAAVASHDTYSTEYRIAMPDHTLRWLQARGKVVRGSDRQAVSLDGVVLDITDQIKRQHRSRFLAELAERVGALTDPGEVIEESARSLGRFLRADRCTYVDIDFPADACIVGYDYHASDSMVGIMGTLKMSEFGEYFTRQMQAGRPVIVDDIYNDPEQVPAESIFAYEAIGSAAFVAVPVLYSTRLVSNMAVHSATPRHWEAEEVDLIRTVIERTWFTAELARQNQALARETEERSIAAERTASILESIGDAFMALDSEWRFTYVNDQMERIVQKKRAELLGVNIWDAFPEAVGTAFETEYSRARREGIPTSFEAFYQPLDLWLEVRAHPSGDGLSIFFRDVNERKLAEAERERMLAEQRARAEREVLISRIGLALRSAPGPEVVLETAVRELGEALGVDRCYYARYDREADKTIVGPEWITAGVLPLAETHQSSRYALNRQADFLAGSTQVMSDTLSIQDSAAEAVGLRSIIRVPLAAGNIRTALSVAMTSEPREWTPDEVALVEAVATQTQTALEAALLTRREHDIAQQLQAALQPAIPAQIPGLSVGAFTKAALEEAEVGGDFMDLFPLDKALYAIVLGDVSGKGLAAAQQLALIRNSLRTTLYLYRDPAQAAATLNAIVTAHDLLVGFVTVFVGIYDATTGEIAYASCGHEPPLVRRADGSVEAIASIGDPPVGVDQNAVYEQRTVTLRSGDALLLYTDGLSEAGQSRRDLLGTAGLLDLFQTTTSCPTMQDCAESLVSQAAAFAGGAFRDDVAVLLAQRQ